MIIKIENYTIGRKIAVLALSSDVYNILVKSNYEVMFLRERENHLTFFPENITIEISSDTFEKLSSCDNYDVFQISENGNAYKCYDNESSDNVLMLTNHCNSNCLMCPATDSMRRLKSDLYPDEILKIIRYMPNDAKHITITGGEPFLIGDVIFDILQLAKERLPNTNFQLLTNGRVLAINDYSDKFLKTAPSHIIVCIPIHGNNAETHDKITCSPGSFVQTCMGITNLINNGFNVEVRIVVSKLNADYIYDIAHLIVSEFPNVHSVKIMGLEMLGNAAKNENDIWLPYENAFSCSKNAINLLIKNSINVSLYNFPLCAIDRKYRFISYKSITDYKVRYPFICNECESKNECGGIFAGSIRLAEKDVKPIKQL